MRVPRAFPVDLGPPKRMRERRATRDCRLGFWRDFQEEHKFCLRGVANLGNPVCSLQWRIKNPLLLHAILACEVGKCKESDRI